MDNTYFTKEYLSFFKALARNNNKEWFDANKKDYQTHVKKAFESFVGHMIEKMKKKYGLGDLKAADCIFRINRDVRFSKDKSPYKLQMSALITKGGKKNMSGTGLYFEIGPEFLTIYSGMYMPEKSQLEKIRKKIATQTKAFEKIINAKAFVQFFEEPKGERSKILPPELKEPAKSCPYIYNKQFYVQHAIMAEKILEPGLDNYLLEAFAAAEAFNEFLD